MRHLVTLYGLDIANPLFRALRRLWPLDIASQPLLALTVALARDPLLRATQPFVLSRHQGALVTREEIQAFLTGIFPGRFSPASLKSLSQNIAGTWTDAGYLSGHRRKTKTLPVAQVEAVVLALFAGHLEGRSGQRLFTSQWITLLNSTTVEVETLANVAMHRNLLVFMNAGGVKEVRFPGYLTPEEEHIRQEATHVV